MTKNEILKCELPKWMDYNYINDLKRYGNKHDGGYLLNEIDLLESNLLLSFGLNDDWSFEKQIKNQTSLPIISYDKSISKNIFFRKILNALLKPWQIRKIIHSIYVFVDYLFFFQGSTKHLKYFVGKKTLSNNFKDLSGVLKSITEEKVFLKIDIEGSEYRILEEILSFQSRFTGIIIEFHDIDLHLEKIKSFIEGLKTHRICHIHVNNFGEIMTHPRLPQVVEITFTINHNLSHTSQMKSPHPLDSPNDRSKTDFEIIFN